MVSVASVSRPRRCQALRFSAKQDVGVVQLILLILNSVNISYFTVNGIYLNFALCKIFNSKFNHQHVWSVVCRLY